MDITCDRCDFPTRGEYFHILKDDDKVILHCKYCNYPWDNYAIIGRPCMHVDNHFFNSKHINNKGRTAWHSRECYKCGLSQRYTKKRGWWKIPKAHKTCNNSRIKQFDGHLVKSAHKK